MFFSRWLNSGAEKNSCWQRLDFTQPAHQWQERQTPGTGFEFACRVAVIV
jgi:hypothetical protein